MFKGSPVTLLGNEVKVGQAAPDFKVQKSADMSDYTLASAGGKTRIIATVPSLDTPVCDQETKRFNEEAGKLSNVEIVCISMDLPFAQKRWCGAANVDKVVTASDHRDASFGKNYGVLISGGPLDRVLARAVFVIGPDNKLKHVEYVGSIGDQPNYDAAPMTFCSPVSSRAICPNSSVTVALRIRVVSANFFFISPMTGPLMSLVG
jgi:thiol peroxidase